MGLNDCEYTLPDNGGSGFNDSDNRRWNKNLKKLQERLRASCKVLKKSPPREKKRGRPRKEKKVHDT